MAQQPGRVGGLSARSFVSEVLRETAQIQSGCATDLGRGRAAVDFLVRPRLLDVPPELKEVPCPPQDDRWNLDNAARSQRESCGAPYWQLLNSVPTAAPILLMCRYHESISAYDTVLQPSFVCWSGGPCAKHVSQLSPKPSAAVGSHSPCQGNRAVLSQFNAHP